MKAPALDYSEGDRLLCSTLVGMVLALLMLAACAKKIDNGPAEKTRMQLETLATILSEHRSKSGELPSAEGLDSIVEIAIGDPTMARILLHDGWGEKIVYRRSSSPILYSIGPNRHDDNGRLDDVVLEVAISK